MRLVARPAALDSAGASFLGGACVRLSAKKLCDNSAASAPGFRCAGQRRRSGVSKGSFRRMISTNQFRNGTAIRVDGKRFTILFFQHVKPGKGGAFVRTRLQEHRQWGRGREDRSGRGEAREREDRVASDDVPLQGRGPALLYGLGHLRSGAGARADVVGEAAGYIVEGGTVTVLSADGEVVSVEPPAHVDLGVARDGSRPQGRYGDGGDQAGHPGDGRRGAGPALCQRRATG